MKKGVLIFWAAIILVILGLFGSTFFISQQPGKLDAFAQCLKDKGAVFYGAFWCPHCQATKRMFGSSAKLLPYVECSTSDGKGQLPVCKDKGIQSYPTWTFPNATTTLTGERTLQELADASSCQLTQ